MLKISLLELFVALIPETILFVIGAYVLTKSVFQWDRIVLTGIAVGIISFAIRLMPIFPGINIILAALTLITLLVLLNKMPVVKAAPSVLLLYLIRLGTEWLNYIFIEKILRITVDEYYNDPIKKIAYGLPFLLLYAVVIYVVYLVNKKARRE